MTRRRGDVAWTALAVAVVLGATLTPAGGARPDGWSGCLLCGDRGLADSILNVALFVPLGLALARWGLRARAVVAVAAALSAAVEVAQFAVPGRDPSPADVVFDALGTACGVALALVLPRLLRPTARGADALAAGWALLFCGWIVAQGWLVGAAVPAPPLRAQWTPEVGDFARYDGRVLDLRVGGVPVAPGPAEPAGVAATLARRDPLEVRWIAASPPRSPAPLVRIVGRGGAEAAAVFVDGADVVVSHRMRAANLRLDLPAFRAAGLLDGVEPGDTVRLAVTVRGGVVRAAIAGGDAMEMRMDAGRGWALLSSDRDRSPRTSSLLDAVWMALWMLPLAFWLRARPMGIAAAMVAGAAVALFPPLAGLAASGMAEWVGAVVGVFAGLAARWTPSPLPPPPNAGGGACRDDGADSGEGDSAAHAAEDGARGEDCRERGGVRGRDRRACRRHVSQ